MTEDIRLSCWPRATYMLSSTVNSLYYYRAENTFHFNIFFPLTLTLDTFIVILSVFMHFF